MTCGHPWLLLWSVYGYTKFWPVFSSRFGQFFPSALPQWRCPRGAQASLLGVGTGAGRCARPRPLRLAHLARDAVQQGQHGADLLLASWLGLAPERGWLWPRAAGQRFPLIAVLNPVVMFPPRPAFRPRHNPSPSSVLGRAPATARPLGRAGPKIPAWPSERPNRGLVV